MNITAAEAISVRISDTGIEYKTPSSPKNFKWTKFKKCLHILSLF